MITGKDQRKVRTQQAPQNLAILHKIALNIIQLDNASKGSKKDKIKKAGWSNKYLEDLLRRTNIIK